MSKYGEPWINSPWGHVFSESDRAYHLAAFCEDRTRQRAVECVNSVSGLDPVKVRQLLDSAIDEGCTWELCKEQDRVEDRCFVCRTLACREENDNGEDVNK